MTHSGNPTPSQLARGFREAERYPPEPRVWNSATERPREGRLVIGFDDFGGEVFLAAWLEEKGRDNVYETGWHRFYDEGDPRPCCISHWFDCIPMLPNGKDPRAI